ncbi:MAG: type II toxin-antitoxin system RelE/ParE family toxin [Blautia sp.]|nr:type II toxin-antitoxin system RelE/ParE family toxin [Blautia sp.]MCM1199665.1 type II toxin-antitoxin system RelE/ParE family toxin [Bacteroides fragilis]
MKNPPAEFTPIPFWFLNDAPDREKIRRQLADYVDKGVTGIVLHPRIGIPKEIPYLSGAYFETVRYVAWTAARLGMRVVLYDEGMYPSGSAHGLVANQVPGEEIAGLYEHQIDFHYLPVAMLQDSVVKDGRLCIGGCRTFKGVWHMRDTCSVIYSPEAMDDLRETYLYIAFTLKVPDTAEKQVSRIRKEIRPLDFMPSRYSIVDWEPWKSMGMHKVPVDNSVVYYTVRNRLEITL